jgi:hypothetical protein
MAHIHKTEAVCDNCCDSTKIQKMAHQDCYWCFDEHGFIETLENKLKLNEAWNRRKKEFTKPCLYVSIGYGENYVYICEDCIRKTLGG